MEKTLTELINLLAVIAIVSIPFLKTRGAGILTLFVITLQAVISATLAFPVLTHDAVEFSFSGSMITGPIIMRLDALSAWFMLIISFTFITGIWYGARYMNKYIGQHYSLKLHFTALLLLYTSLIDLCMAQNAIVFLVIWEIMALSSFLSVIFEHDKGTTLKGGINYLIQSHVSVIFLTVGFIWAAIKTGSYDFKAITDYFGVQPTGVSLFLFLLFFIGFAFKAGFVPFHSWLPYAHPAAPAPVSGIMSGVLIKIGIYGILRMLLIIKPDYTSTGYFIVVISIISGLYGVMLAIVQHDLKKLLAYHSVENIGIIGLGIGIGCIGLGTGNQLVASLGFAGALLHTLNHALFKSLLFYSAGIVYQATHTINIEHLGGLIKKMPHTAALFLIAAIAISGLPPFNGFISEFIIYNGLYQWLQAAPTASIIGALLLIFGLVLIGGLALLCFTKAFSIVFLGNARKEFHHEIKEAPFVQLLPLYFIAFLILLIGLYPQMFLNILIAPVNLFSAMPGGINQPFQGKAFEAMQPISWAMTGLILLSLLIYSISRLVLRNRKISIDSTWGCGYVGPAAKQQYTASSFVRTYSKLNSATLLFDKHEKEIKGIFPDEGYYESHAYDKIEKWLIDKPVQSIKSFLSRFLFLQNGRLQSYILYGILFIVALIIIPMIFEKIVSFIEFIKQL
jgi:hydrogenase-4 component B